MNIHSLLLPPTLLQRLSDNPLQLAVDGAELIVSPFLHRFHGLRIDAEQEGLVVAGIVFFLRHYQSLSIFDAGLGTSGHETDSLSRVSFLVVSRPTESPKVLAQMLSLAICLS